MESRSSAMVLIVDDEERNRKLFEVFVKADGYTALSATGGREGVEMAFAAHPDIILLDLMMPGMDGFEVARQLKMDPRTHGIPVVVLSSLDDDAARARLRASGAEELIAKPVDRWKLSQTLARLLGRNAAPAPASPDETGARGDA